MAHAREAIESWRTEYNTERPHSSLEELMPEQVAAKTPSSGIAAHEEGENRLEVPEWNQMRTLARDRTNRDHPSTDISGHSAAQVSFRRAGIRMDR